MHISLAEVLADGKGVSVRKGLKEARVQTYEPTNRQPGRSQRLVRFLLTHRVNNRTL